MARSGFRASLSFFEKLSVRLLDLHGFFSLVLLLVVGRDRPSQISCEAIWLVKGVPFLDDLDASIAEYGQAQSFSRQTGARFGSISDRGTCLL